MTMQSIADQMQFITHHLTTTTMLDGQAASPVKKKQRQHVELHDKSKPTFFSHESGPPNNKLPTDDDHLDRNLYAAQEDAQYTPPRSPGSAMEE